MDQHNNQDGNRHFPYQHYPNITNTGVFTGGQPHYQSAALQRQAGAMQHPHVSMTSQNLGKRSSVHGLDDQLYNKRSRNNNFQQPYSQHISSGYISNDPPYVSAPGPAQGSIQNYSTPPLMPPGIPGNIAQSSNLQDRPWLINTLTYQSPYNTNGIPPSVKQKPKAPSTTSSSIITPARQSDQPRSNYRSQSTSQPVRVKKPARCSGPPYEECCVKSNGHTACNRLGSGNSNDKPLSSEDNALYWTIHEVLYGPRPAKETPASVSANQAYPSSQATSANTAAQNPVSFSAYPRYPSNYAPDNDLKGHQSPTPQEIFRNRYVNGAALPRMSPEFQARSLYDSTHNRQQAQTSQSTHTRSQAHDVNPHPECGSEQRHHITQIPQTSTTRQSGLETPPIRKSPCQSDSTVKEEVESHVEQDPHPHHGDTIKEAALPVDKVSPQLLANALALVRPQTRARSHEIQNEPQIQSRASSSIAHQSNAAPSTQIVSQQPENHFQKRPAKCAQGLPLTFTPGFRDNLKWVYTGFQREANSDDKGPWKALNYSSGTVASAVELLNINWNEEHAYYSELGASMGKWVPK